MTTPLIADILSDAADILRDQHELAKETWFDADRRCHCTVAAISEAIIRRGVPGASNKHDNLLDAACAAAMTVIGRDVDPRIARHDLYEWNDRPQRTKDQAEKALRDAAQAERLKV